MILLSLPPATAAARWTPGLHVLPKNVSILKYRRGKSRLLDQGIPRVPHSLCSEGYWARSST